MLAAGLRALRAARPPMPFVFALAVLAVGVLILVLGTGRAIAVDACAQGTKKTWDGGGGDNLWSTAANWSGNTLPATSSNVCLQGAPGPIELNSGATVRSFQSDGVALHVTGGTFTVTNAADGAVTNSTLRLTGGATLNGAAPWSVRSGGSFVWEGGSTLGGPTGAGTAPGLFTIAPGATLSISGPAGARYLDRRVLVLNGTGTWSTASDYYVQLATSARIDVGGTLTLQNDAAFYDGGGGDERAIRVLAGGALKKDTATGQSYIGLPIDNDGTVQADSGQLMLTGGGTGTSTGTWSAVSGAANELQSGTLQIAGGTIAGAGAGLRLAGGTLTLGGSSTVAPGGTLRASYGTIDGTGDLDVIGRLLWDGSMTMAGAGTTTITPSGTLESTDGSSNGYRTVDAARLLRVDGTATMTGTHSLYLGNEARLEVGGLLDIAGDNAIHNWGGPEAPLHVLPGGDVERTTSGATVYIGAPVENDGTVTAASGDLQLAGGSGAGISNGRFEALVGRRLELTSGTHLLTGATVAGEGAGLRIAGGEARFDGPASTVEADGELALSDGTMSGDGIVDVAGRLTWDGGSSMTGSGRTQVTGTFSMTDATDADYRVLDGGRKLTIAGAGGRTGTHALYLGNASTLEVSGTLTLGSAASAYNWGGAASLLRVAPGGDLVVDSGSGFAYYGVPLDNDGTIQADSGTIQFGAGSETATSTGAFTGAGGTTELYGGTFLLDGVSVGGTSGLQVTGGEARFDGAGGTVGPDARLMLRSGTISGDGDLAVDGTFDWLGNSTMTGTGTTTVAAGGSFTMADPWASGYRVLDGGRTLRVDADGDWQDATTFYMGNASTFEINGNLDVVNGGSIYHWGGADSLVHVLPSGELRKTGGAGPFRVEIPLENDGLVETASADLVVMNPRDYDAATNTLNGKAFAATNGAELTLQGAQVHTLGAEVTLGGPSAHLDDGAGSDALGSLDTIAAGGRLALRNGKSYTFSGSLQNDGTVDLGSASTLRYLTDYAQGAGGTLRTQVAGTTPGTNAGWLRADGTASLAGTLAVDASITPVAGDNVEVVTAGTRTGSFGTVTGASDFDVDYGPTFVRLKGKGQTTIGIDDLWAMEGDAGTSTVTFKVRLSGPSAAPVTVTAATAKGTATSPGDFTARPATVLTFAPGETVKDFAVTVKGDTFKEGRETFTVKLSKPSSNATIADAAGTATLDNEEGGLFLSAGDAHTTEGGPGGTQQLEFPISISEAPAAGQTVTVKYSTAAGSAGNADFTGENGTLTFTSATATTQIVSVAVTGDATVEPNETMTLKLGTAAGAAREDTAATGVIVNDDGAPGAAPLPYLTVSDLDVLEADGGTTAGSVKVRLSAPAAGNVTFKVASGPGTATSPADFAAIPTQNVTFTPGQTEKTVGVTVNGDTLKEGAETFNVKISNAAGATIADTSGAVTIHDTEGPIWAYVTDATVTEGDAGTSTASFSVSLSSTPDPGQTVSVKVATANGTAAAPGDFTALAATTLTFTSATGPVQNVSIPVSGDNAVEPDETFRLNLTAPNGLVIADTSGMGTILTDD